MSTPAAAPSDARRPEAAAIADAVATLTREFGDSWHFEILHHLRLGDAVEVTGELRAGGRTVRETGRANGLDRSLGARLEAASDACLLSCAHAALGRGGADRFGHGVDRGDIAVSGAGSGASSGAASTVPVSNTPRPAAPVRAQATARPAPVERTPLVRTPAPRDAQPVSRAPAPTARPAPQPDAGQPSPSAPSPRPAVAPSARTGSAPRPSSDLDPVTLRVVGGAFNAIAKEMAHVLYRMSYSSIIRESEDLGCGIFDNDGNELCESESTPMHIGSLPWYIRGIRKRLGDDIHEGDVIIHNHPYFGASHTPDLAVLVPIFHEGQMVGFSGNTAHLLDMGGAAPGINVDVVDVFAEAKLFNAIKLYENGKRNNEIWQMLIDNVRTPDMDTSDIEAMIASVELGRDRFIQLMDKYGRQTVMDTAYYWMDYSEHMLRAEIEKLPDGDYHSEGWLDDDGKNRDQPLKVNVTVRVRGSDITIDLTGSAPEVETGFNVPYEGSLIVACNYIVRTLLLDEATLEEFVPQNEGIFRPVKVVAPKGTIFNPNFPRACFSRFAQIQRVLDCTIQALAPVIPEKATGGNSASLYFISYSGFVAEKGQYWMYLEVDEGSYGGRFGKDGMDSVDNLMANTRNNPVEELDMHYPLRNERYELRPDPPAAGQWRGGIGIVRENRFLTDGFLSCEADRHLEAPVGVFGGMPGLTGRLTKNPDTPTEENWPSKITGYKMKENDVIRITGPSGGGYGDPHKRDPNMVLSDYLDDYIDLDMARDVYGVVIDARTDRVDVDATRRLRVA